MKIRLITFGVLLAHIPTGLSAQDPPLLAPLEVPAEGGKNSYPDGVSPSDVFAQAELLDRCLDRLLEAWIEKGIADVTWNDRQLPHKVDLDLRPMHVYQIMLTCSWRLQQLANHPELQTRPMPTLASNPREYEPRDVQLLVELMLKNVRGMAKHLDVDDLPSKVQERVNKTPTDVFQVGVRIFTKISALLGDTELMPNEVLSQMRRATADVRSILRQTDPACRYRIDCPDNKVRRTPSDVFQKCVEIRKKINQQALALKTKPTPLPVVANQLELRPRDVFLQTQIIIAELNLLKLHTNTVSSTPLTIPSPETTEPTDVYQEAMMTEYLLNQVKPK